MYRYTIAQAFPRESFIYHFNEPNPWDGPSGGEAGHVLDIAFFFQNFNEYLDSNQEESAKAFGRDIITFVNGEEPFPAHEAQAGGAKVYGLPSNSGGAFVKSKDPADYGRRSVIWQLAPVFGLDKLAFALTMFLVGQ